MKTSKLMKEERNTKLMSLISNIKVQNLIIIDAILQVDHMFG